MASRIPTLALLMSLVACGTNHQVPVRGDPEYLEGVTSRYSIRLDELQPRNDHSDSRLPGAVVAGDGSITLTGSMIRQDPYLALDLVIHNRGDSPIVVQRSNIRLRDNLGTRLTAVGDFPGAENVGLRAETLERAAVEPNVHLNPSGPAPSSTERQAKVTSADHRVSTRSDEPEDHLWLSDLVGEPTTAPAPDVLHLAPGDRRAYWAYWLAEDVEYPLFVMAHVDGKSLMLKFDARPVP